MVAPPPGISIVSRARLVAVLLSLALAGCGGSGFGDMTASVANSARGLVGAREPGQPIPVQIFVASTRRDDRRVGDAVADGGVHHSLVMVTLPPGHRPGAIEEPTFGKASAASHFVLAEGRNLTPERFNAELATHLSGRVGADRDILLFVHGFNTSLDEARFRLAQIVADARFGGVPVLYTWPSQSNVFSYVTAKERATVSRDALEDLMRELAATPGAGRVHLLAHSMGAWLTMEALRENAIAGHPDLDGKLGEVMLAAPDIDIAVFRNQLARLNGKARVSLLVSRGDRALGLSSKLAGDRPRLGAIDPDKPAEYAELTRLGVKIYDLSKYSNGFIGHGAYASAPDVIRGIGAQLAGPRNGEAAKMADTEALAVDPETNVAEAPAPRAPIEAQPLEAPAGR